MVLPTELPVEDPVLIFALAMLIFLTAPLILERYRLPGIVGIILVGTILGPNATGILDRDATIILLGEVGLIYLMFVAGLEVDVNDFLDNRNRSANFAAISFGIPQLVGTIVGVAVIGLDFFPALLFASIVASHTLLAYPVLNRFNIVKNDAITTAIGGTIITDTLALLVLAIVAGRVEGELTLLFWIQLGVGLVLLFGGIWVLVPRVGRWFFNQTVEESYYEFLFVMATLFVCAYLAELAGVKHIIGAFLAGLALNRLIVKTGTLMNRIEFVGNALFIPFFLLSVGMLVDARVVVAGPETIMTAGSLLAVVLVTKFVAALGTGRMYDYTVNESRAVFGLTVGQAASALAIVLIGFDIGIFDQHVVNGAVLMILAVSVISPAVVRRYGRDIALAMESAEYDPSDEPERIMMVLSPEAEYIGPLFEFALILHDEATTEPLYAVTVVPPGTDDESRLADAEAHLDAAAEYVSGAEVELRTQTRVDRTIPTGIVHAARDNRITTLVMGWDGERSEQVSVFGNIIDAVIEQTDIPLAIAHMREPISVSKRVIVIVPPGISSNPGFYESIHQVKRIAATVEAPIEVLIVRGATAHYETRFERVEPEHPITVRSAGDWAGLLSTLRDEVGEDDLIISLSARKRTIGWDQKLEMLPKSISTLSQDNFIVLYPPRGDRVDDRRFFSIR